MIGTAHERRLAEIFVEVADSLVEDFDVIDLLQRLSTRCVELLDVSAAGIPLADAHGELQIIAASDEHTRLLELFALQHDQGPCVECHRTGSPRTDIDLTRPETTTGWPDFTARARETGYTATQPSRCACATGSSAPSTSSSPPRTAWATTTSPWPGPSPTWPPSRSCSSAPWSGRTSRTAGCRPRSRAAC
nr:MULTISPECIES: hypothetical protein [unclassified Streptomyces]